MQLISVFIRHHALVATHFSITMYSSAYCHVCVLTLQPVYFIVPLPFRSTKAERFMKQHGNANETA